MRIRSVECLLGGEILAEPVLTSENDILIPIGTELKEEYIPLIQSLGVETLMIEDPYEDYENPNSIITSSQFDKYVEKVRKLMESHIYKNSSKSLKEFEIIATDIVREIDKMSGEELIDIKERSSNLYEHTVFVTLLSVMIAKRLKMDFKKKYNIAIGCLLHDIGIRYITIPYQNRNFDEADPTEVFEFKKHTILGYSALDDENWIPTISKKMILSHHENISGTGFPMRQKNKEIECKIIQACDAFDCYISGMECKRLSVQDTISKMIEKSGTLFEKKIVDNLVAMIAKYPVGTTVKTSQESKGVVISQTNDPDNPIIMILDTELSNEDEYSKLNLMLEKDVSILQVV
ncbi:MAG: HD domain-containing protein [Agathobacter sp.]|nr:HD domain-containing protein [Agathobacter sp.]